VVEDARAAAEIAAAELAVARSDVAVAEAAVADAQAQAQMESVLLDHYVLRAPYDALVISRNKELGAVVAPGEALFRVINPATVWTRAYVDEALAGVCKWSNGQKCTCDHSRGKSSTHASSGSRSKATGSPRNAGSTSSATSARAISISASKPRYSSRSQGSRARY
jgi:multidrug resistance efflux pump